MVQSVVASAAILLLLAGHAVRAQEQGIRCSNGAFQHDCPNQSPVCCFKTDGTPNGCCPIGHRCADGGGCDPVHLPKNATPLEEHDISEDVHMRLSTIVEAAVTMLSALILTAVGVFLCLWWRQWRQERQARRALQEELDGNDSSSDDDVSSQTEADLEAELADARTPGGVDPINGEDDGEATRLLPPCSATAADPTGCTAGVRCCVKCNLRPVSCMLFPCEHTCMCHECACRSKRCPECHKIIKKRKRMFLVG